MMALGSFCLPEQFKLVQALQPQALGAARTGDIINVKTANRVWVIVEVARGANATDLNLYIYKDTGDGVAGTAITTVVPIWANLDTGTTDTLVAQTAAVSIATGTAQSVNMQFVFQIDPITLGDTYDWIYLLTDASNAAHFIAATYLLEGKYKQATPPSVIA
jgi:hypothetical protein